MKSLSGLFTYYKNRLKRLFVEKQHITGTFVIVTGADSSHYKSACQLLTSFFEHENDKIIFFDLGLSVNEADEIKSLFKDVIYRKFDYSQYPKYFNIRENAGEYAWKPVIIWQVMEEFQTRIIWMDAGNVITKKLENLKKMVIKYGFYSSKSPGTISDWTHIKSLVYLDVSKKLYGKQNLNGALVAFNYQKPKARELARMWKECAMKKECIAPDGSNRKNHRQDQAVLSVLSYQCGLAQKIFSINTGVKIQQDID
jgi:hypothetical protein